MFHEDDKGEMKNVILVFLQGMTQEINEEK
jgi:hypothetical protein